MDTMRLSHNPFATPLSNLSGIAVLLFASARLSYALVSLVAVVFIYCMTMLSQVWMRQLSHRTVSGIVPMLFSSVWTALFISLLGLVSPIITMDMSLLLLLVPVSFISSSLLERSVNAPPLDALSFAFTDSLLLGGLSIALSLVREPLGFGTFTIPMRNGILELIPHEGFQPLLLQTLGTSVGAFFLFAYGLAAYAWFVSRRSPAEGGAR